MILLGEQIVKFKDGTQKTLEEFVAEGAALTPETPVNVLDDSMELEDYIKEIAEESGGVGAWELRVEIEDLECGHNYDVPQDLTSLLNGSYTDVCIVTHIHENTSGYTYADDFLVIPFDIFKAYLLTENFIHFSGFGATAVSFPQQTSPYGFKLQTVEGVLKLWYFGATHFTTNNVLLDIKIYTR